MGFRILTNSFPFLALLIALGCGRIEYVRNGNRDPDVLEAIKEENMRILSGKWSFALKRTGGKGAAQYMAFEGSEYLISEVSRDGEILGTDWGTFEHVALGSIRLSSRNPACDAIKSSQSLIFSFQAGIAGELAILNSRKQVVGSGISLTELEIARTSACLYKSDSEFVRIKGN